MAIFYTDSGSFNNLEVTGSTILSGSLIISGALFGGGTTEEFGGNGGDATDNVISSGLNGFTPTILYGGGGGGAAKASGGNRSGGAGAQGLIRISYR